jgi:uncharacterized protein (TIGR02598 family)
MKFIIPRRRGFSLVEVVMALGISSFCLLSTLALLPIGISSSRDSLEKTNAASIVAEISSDFRQAAVTVGTGGSAYQATPRFQINSGAGTSTLYFGADDSYINATASSAPVSGNWLYRATVTVSLTSSGSTMPVRILVTWPALADPNPAQTPANYTGSLDISTAVNTLSR